MLKYIKFDLESYLFAGFQVRKTLLTVMFALLQSHNATVVPSFNLQN